MCPFALKFRRVSLVAMLIAVAMFALAGRVCASGHASKPAKAAKHGSQDSHSAQDSHGSHGSHEAEEPPEDTSDLETAGLKLGEYKIRTDYPVESQKSTVRFILYASVKGKHSNEMRQIVKEHEQKVRDLVITSTRLAPLSLFEEPDLASFRRRLIVRIRRTFPELAVEDLYISDFGLMVKSL